jgi:hypothetical protein
MSARLDEYEGAPELAGQVRYEPDWYLLDISADGHAHLLALLDPLDFAIKPSARPHISIMKGEAPCRNAADWGVAFVDERVAFRFHPTVRDENGLHLWVDCYSPRLCELRQHFGLTTLTRGDGVHLVNFHLTIGRRKKAVEKRSRPQLRLSPQSHIDVETGMQHL